MTISEKLLSLTEANIPFDLNIAKKLQLGCVVGIEFRSDRAKNRPVNPDYPLTSDGWFRRDPQVSRVAGGYGLAIRGLKASSNEPVKYTHFNVYKGVMIYLPSAENEDDPAKYESEYVWIWVYNGSVGKDKPSEPGYTIEEVLKYVKETKHEWVP